MRLGYSRFPPEKLALLENLSRIRRVNELATTPLERAIKAADGMTSLLRKLNERGHDISSHQTIYQWKKTGRVPAEYCPDIEALTGVRCEELRPDVNWAVLRKTAKAA